MLKPTPALQTQFDDALAQVQSAFNQRQPESDRELGVLKSRFFLLDVLFEMMGAQGKRQSPLLIEALRKSMCEDFVACAEMCSERDQMLRAALLCNEIQNQTQT